MANIWHKGTDEAGKGKIKKMFGNKILWERPEAADNQDAEPGVHQSRQRMDKQPRHDKWDWGQKYYENGWSENWPSQKRVSKWNYDNYGRTPQGGGWVKSVLTNKFLVQTVVAVLIFAVAVGIYDKQDPTSQVASRAVKYLLNADVNYEPIMGRIVKLVFPELAGGPINPEGGVIAAVGQQNGQTGGGKDTPNKTPADVNTPGGTSPGAAPSDTNPQTSDLADNSVSASVSAKMTIPLNGTVIKKYGWITDEQDGLKRYHEGIDIKASLGTKITAALDGKVVKVGESTELGKYVQLSHNGDVSTLYAHLDKVLVKANDVVKEGDYLATVGVTGSKDTPHLHFEIREKDELVDPWSKLNESGL